MAETFLTFDFGTNEETAQQARHKLDGWKQAFRLDKKLLFKFDRGDAAAAEPAEDASAQARAKVAEKAKSNKEEKPAAAAGTVKLLVRLYFSNHERLSAQRWVQRLSAEDPFKGAAPRVVSHRDPDFTATRERFENLT